jgi:hypothetical protein
MRRLTHDDMTHTDADIDMVTQTHRHTDTQTHGDRTLGRLARDAKIMLLALASTELVAD